ncbi:MAG TPA: lytic transglycosylase domain-containing protein [Metalysinibacillus jejuensis]|uniref:Lytic transglycosylase domain-containing protein n=1 Tax=Metalysinibacillus jejuensis TaxID=914327 RepID=A0A921NBV2_9BACL|nr:lytic transglycosylase domain-containing protein [Metalysinibacillus jejuensis]HJH10808.1 lytic transglycosylase domain-containing protein [Metalysinibacillus jejuensis]
MQKIKLGLIFLLIPTAIAVYTMLFFVWQGLKELPIVQQFTQEETSTVQALFDIPIPEEYIPIYMAAEEAYHVPWTLLAAHHRIETRFSTMSTLVSPAGAVGHMQFMPCTFVGWQHPTCEGLGKGKIPTNELTSLAVIAQYGGYGVDANGDGIADPYDIEDAIFSAANYLAHAGAASGEIEKAVFNYNHSDKYVRDVMHFYQLYSEHKDALVSLIHTAKEEG